MFPLSYSLKKAIHFPSSRSVLPSWKLLHISALPCLTSREEQEAILEAVCVNLRRKKWNFLRHILPALPEHLVRTVIFMHRTSPLLSLEFFNLAQQLQTERKILCLSLESYSVMVHVLVAGRRFEEALSLMKHLTQSMGVPVLEIVGSLVSSHRDFGGSTDSFDTLVRACTQIGRGGDACKVIERLRALGFWVSVHAWNNLLSYLSKIDDRGFEFWRTYRKMLTYGYAIPNVNTYNSAIYALCRECRLSEASSVVCSMLKCGVLPNFVTANMLIDGWCRCGEVWAAFQLVKKIRCKVGSLVLLNSVSFNCLVNGLCKTGNTATAEVIVGVDMTKLGVERNVRTYATLIDGYAREGKLEDSFRLCDQMLREGLSPNTVVYNTIMHWLFKGGYVEEASFLLSDMELMHIPPDHITYTVLVDGYRRNRPVKDAIRYYCKNSDTNVMSDVFIYNILVNNLFKDKDMRGAKQLFGRMFTHGILPDLVTYSTLIDGYCQEQRYCQEQKHEDALHVYDQMVTEGHKPTVRTYNSFINLLCMNEMFDLATTVIGGMMKQGPFPDIVTYNTLLSSYCRCQRTGDVFALCYEMKRLGVQKNVVTYNVLINYLCKARCFQQATDFMKLMLERGLLPDCITYTTLITEFKKNCSASEVIALHDYMVTRGVPLDERTFNGIVSLLIERDSL